MAGENLQGLQAQDVRYLMKSENAPFVKQYLVYDADGDVTSIFFAQANAISGELCLEQDFFYQTVSGNKNMTKSGWKTATWGGAAWDM